MNTTATHQSSQHVLMRIFLVCLFGIAFAWVESAVVVYLREIYYKGSFYFPLVMQWENGECALDRLMKIEFVREIATILMLITVGYLSGGNRLQKFSFFMIAFGVWDIFYYIWLKVMTGWPDSLMTWDLLFFVPVPWVGPVITPVLIAAVMIAAGTLIIFYDEKAGPIKWKWYDWGVEFICAFLMIVAFCWDWKNIMQVPDGMMHDGIPVRFAWWLFAPAYVFSVYYFIVRFRHVTRKKT